MLSHLRERRLVLVLGAVVFVDTVFYAAIAPLLPALAHELRLSKLSAGVLTASYPIGTLVGALPGGLLTVRIGAKRTVYAGLVLLASSTLAFGWLHSAVGLDAARLIEGVGGACSWAGAMAWLVAEAPPSRRGQTIGAALGAAIAGAVFGPVVGTIASALGRGPTFSGVVVLAVVLIDQARRIPLHHRAPAERVQGASRRRELAGPMWLVALPAVATGVISVLAPLRLHRLGANAAAIGAAFLVAAALESALSPVVGRWSDRHGRSVPLRTGLAATAAVLACFTLPSSALLLAVLVTVMSGALAAFWAPAMALLSDAADAIGLEQGYAWALVNLAWAFGQTVGSGVGGAVAKAASDAVSTGAAAGLMVLTLLYLVGRRRPVPAAATGGAPGAQTP